MPKKTPSNAKTTRVQAGNISDVSGNVNIAGGNITTHHTVSGLSAAEIEQVFDRLYRQIESRPDTSSADREDLKAEVHEIQEAVSAAVQENQKVDEGFLARRFRNIARMAPDLLDVVVTTLGNPLAGLGVAIRKIAEKAKEETKG